MRIALTAVMLLLLLPVAAASCLPLTPQEPNEKCPIFLKHDGGKAYSTNVCMGTMPIRGGIPPEYQAALGPGQPPAGDAPQPSGGPRTGWLAVAALAVVALGAFLLRARGAFLALLLLLAAAAPAVALSCVPMTPDEHFQRANVVVMGSVVLVTGTPRSPNDYQVVRIAAETYYKGQLGKTFDFRHNPLVGPNIPFQPGERWLLFLAADGKGSYATSPCHGTQFAAAGVPAAYQAVLGQGQPPGDFATLLTLQQQEDRSGTWTIAAVLGGAAAALAYGMWRARRR